MDSRELIRLQRLPFKQRIEEQYEIFHPSIQEDLLMAREGIAPVTTQMLYKDIKSGDFKKVLVFGSNNYLGFSTNPYILEKVGEAVKNYGVGTGGSPAFSGYTKQHKELEKRLAALAGHDAALLLPGGFMANLCWVNGLMNRNDILLYDKHSHASVLNAIKMTGVRFFPYDPDDLNGFKKLIADVKKREGKDIQLFSTVEGVRSIDGTVIELTEYLEVCKQEGIFIVLDDAHGLGTLGKYGKGTLEHLNLIGQVDMRMSTCSKAMGAQGAFLSGSEKAIFVLRNFATPYVFTTALAQPIVAGISAGLDLLEREPERIAQLHSNVRYMQDRLEEIGFKILRGHAGIIPVYLPDGIAIKFNQKLYENKLFVNVMMYPMVPPGRERVRLSLMSTHSKEEMDQALSILREAAKEFNVI